MFRGHTPNRAGGSPHACAQHDPGQAPIPRAGGPGETGIWSRLLTCQMPGVAPGLPQSHPHRLQGHRAVDPAVELVTAQPVSPRAAFSLPSQARLRGVSGTLIVLHPSKATMRHRPDSTPGMRGPASTSNSASSGAAPGVGGIRPSSAVPGCGRQRRRTEPPCGQACRADVRCWAGRRGQCARFCRSRCAVSRSRSCRESCVPADEDRASALVTIGHQLVVG